MSNYSFETSYPPYKENEALNKKRQCDELFDFIRWGANNLLQLSKLSGLPQSTVSARASDLIKEGRILYNGFTVYNERKRKKIIIVKPVAEKVQGELFG